MLINHIPIAPYEEGSLLWLTSSPPYYLERGHAKKRNCGNWKLLKESMQVNQKRMSPSIPPKVLTHSLKLIITSKTRTGTSSLLWFKTNEPKEVLDTFHHVLCCQVANTLNKYMPIYIYQNMHFFVAAKYL